MPLASPSAIVPATTYRAIVGRVLQVVRESKKAQFPNQQAFADAVGLSQPTLSRIESGTGNVSIDQLKRLADALGVAPAEILGRADKAAADLARRGVRVVDQIPQADPTLAVLGATALAALLIAVLAKK
jgi:transcriptional regulator with XRE-family HTH domain